MNETNYEVLYRLYGKKETYTLIEVLDAMTEFAFIKSEIAHENAMQTIKAITK